MLLVNFQKRVDQKIYLQQVVDHHRATTKEHPKIIEWKEKSEPLASLEKEDHMGAAAQRVYLKHPDR